MFIRALDNVIGTEHYKVLHDGATRKSASGSEARGFSARYLTASDGMGFSFHVNQIAAGPAIPLWYKHHWEANYILSGKVSVSDLTTGEEWLVGPDNIYIVGPNDRHQFHVLEDERHVSIFCPALRGDEIHDEDGAYAASGPVPETDQRMFVKRCSEMRSGGEEMVVANGAARVVRPLTKSHGLGFSFSEVDFAPGASTVLWYKHHWEANYIISGTGLVEDLGTGESWRLEPGVDYNVGPKDRHRLSAHTEMRLVSVFCPALEGNEQHDADGALGPSGPVPLGPPGY